MLMTISSYSSNNSGRKTANANRRSAADRRKLKRLAVRLTAAMLFFFLLFVGFSLMKGNAVSEYPSAPAAGEKAITISSGQTLWGIAGELRREGEDIRRIIYDLKERNNLTSSTLTAGQTLIIPAD